MGNNKVFLTGEVIRTTVNIRKEAVFTLKTNDDTTPDTEYTESHIIICRDIHLTEAVKESVRIGSQVYVEGTIRNSLFNDNLCTNNPKLVEAESIKIWNEDTETWIEAKLG